MIQCDIIIETTWAASTSIIPLPTGFPHIAVIPTTQYLQGADGLLEVKIRRYDPDGVQINRQAVKYNVLKLHYRAVGELVRP